MTTLVNNDPHGHRYWLKGPDGNIHEIHTKGVTSLALGHYQIASVEPVITPVPNIPPPTETSIVNVGQETIFFVAIIGSTVEEFFLEEGQGRPLQHATYHLASEHIPPPK